MQTQLFDIIFNEDEISWQNMIYKLVKDEGMNPWDVNIAELSEKFLDMLQKIKKMDFRVSGKVILAAAILLRIKSRRLVGEDFNHLNRLIAMGESADEEDFYDSLEEEFGSTMDYQYEDAKANPELFELTPRTPLPRKRKVSVYDLVDALQKALEVKNRRVNRLTEDTAPEVVIPTKTKDISEMILEIYDEIKMYFTAEQQKKMRFTQIVPEGSSKDEKISAFMPLLYLENQRRIDLHQERHLHEIEITINREFNEVEAIETEEEVAQ